MDPDCCKLLHLAYRVPGIGCGLRLQKPERGIALGLHVAFMWRPTWAPKVCKIMAFMAIIMGLGLLFYILLGFRYSLLGALE